MTGAEDALPLAPLEGVRVVALEQYIAGPLCTQTLADAGAEVIKVERPEGDPRRSYPPVRQVDGAPLSGGFAPFNRGKKSVVLDLHTDGGRQGLHRLLDSATLMVSNLRPGTLERLGITGGDLATRHPNLTHVEISGFGVSTGPYQGRPAFDAVAQAMGGLATLSGDADGTPRLAAAGTADVLAGVQAAVGALTALSAGLLGRPVHHVDVSMYDVVVSFLQRQAALHTFTGSVPIGPDPYTPAGLFRAGDGEWLALLLTTDDLWRRLCGAIGAADWVADPRLSSAPGRGASMADVVVPRLEEWSRGLTGVEAQARLERSGLPVGTVQTLEQLSRCPHLAARGLWGLVSETDPSAPALVGPPLRFDGSRPQVWRVPRLGEHTQEVLSSLQT